MLQTGMIVGGWDKYEGGKIYGVPLGGTILEQPFAIGGLLFSSEYVFLSRLYSSHYADIFNVAIFTSVWFVSPVIFFIFFFIRASQSCNCGQFYFHSISKKIYILTGVL